MRIALLGDIGLFGKNAIATEEDALCRFGEVKKVLMDCDAVIGNLETPLTGRTKVCKGKSAYLKTVPESIAVLKTLGVTHVSLANNHMYDYCRAGAEDTVNALEKAGIEWYGLDGKSALIEGDSKLSLRGYCCWSANPRGMAENGQGKGVNALNPLVMEQQLAEDKANGYLSILSCHFGQEHIHLPNSDHVKCFRKLAAQGDFIMHGHHPHVLQGYEKTNNSLLFYSLGNFCFDDVYTKKSNAPLVKMSEANKQSMICIIDIEERTVSNFSIIPTFDDGLKISCSSDDGAFREEMQSWSQAIVKVDEAYDSQRSKLFSEFISGRKQQRDLQWYLKRLNLESVRMIRNSRYNAKQYAHTVKAYLTEESGRTGGFTVM